MSVNINQNKSEIFSSFPNYTFEQSVVPANQGINKIKISDGLSDTVELNGKKPFSKAKKILFGSTIASTILSVGVVSMILAKGVHGSSFKKLAKLKEHLVKEIQETSISSTKDLANKTALYAKKGTKKTIDGLQATSNFTAIKDWLCDKALRTNKATAKFADGTKNLFKKIVDKTLGKKYNKVEINVKDLTSLLKHYNISNLSMLDDAQKMKSITIKGTTKPLSEWLEILSSQTQKLETSYDKGFSLGARKLRSQKRSQLLSGIKDKIEEKFFKNKGLLKASNYKTYVTEDVSSAAQQELKADILRAKKQVTNNIGSIHDNIKGQISKFSQSINPEDKFSVDLLHTLKQQLEQFKSCSGSTEEKTRKEIARQITGCIDDAYAVIKNNSRYSRSQQEEIIKNLEGIKTSLMSTNSGSKGALEEIMTILKGLNTAELGNGGRKIISDAEFKEFSKLSSKISKGLEKATDLEMGEYFLKQAELEVGSAATDVFSVLFPVAAGTYAVAKGDDKDEKISAVLTTCLPLVGTFATFVYGTTKMLSGAKNLIFSGVSGIVLSKLGSYCDKLYKKYKAEGSVVKVAKDEYENFMTDITPKYILEPEEKK